MIIGALEIKIHLPWVLSLKEKRSEVSSLIKKVQNKFHTSIAQVGELDNHKIIVLGITVVSNDSMHAESMMDKILLFLEENTNGNIIDITREVIHY